MGRVADAKDLEFPRAVPITDGMDAISRPAAMRVPAPGALLRGSGAPPRPLGAPPGYLGISPEPTGSLARPASTSVRATGSAVGGAGSGGEGGRWAEALLPRAASVLACRSDLGRAVYAHRPEAPSAGVPWWSCVRRSTGS